MMSRIDFPPFSEEPGSLLLLLPSSQPACLCPGFPPPPKPPSSPPPSSNGGSALPKAPLPTHQIPPSPTLHSAGGSLPSTFRGWILLPPGLQYGWIFGNLPNRFWHPPPPLENFQEIVYIVAQCCPLTPTQNLFGKPILCISHFRHNIFRFRI